jgi:two-component system, NtrC family, nitrogen regulation response regulator GlnG
MNTTVLLVDDEPQLLRAAGMVLESSGRHEVVTLSDSRAVLPLLESRAVDVIVTDLGMPHLSGTGLLQELVASQPDIPVIVMTGTSDLDTAVQCMQAGAVDYLLKPVDPARLASAVNRALELRGLRTDMLRMKQAILEVLPGAHAAFADVITNDRKMLAVFRLLEVLANSARPVLITGESGTGKELLARAVHRLSKRAGAFVTINVAGMDDATFTATLFGRATPSFGVPGAPAARDGLVRSVGAGTVYLEELGELAIPSQVKLLQLLQDGTFYPVDSDQPRHSEARYVVSARTGLRDEMKAGRFRPDLYSRLQGQHVELPPLRERLADLPLLVPYFLDQAAADRGQRAPQVRAQLYQLLRTYRFPRNVSELRAMCFEAMARHQGNVLAHRSFQEVIEANRGDPAPAQTGQDRPPALWFPEEMPTLEETERALIDEALRRAGGNQRVAATLIGMERATLNARLMRRKRKLPPQEPPA